MEQSMLDEARKILPDSDGAPVPTQDEAPDEPAKKEPAKAAEPVETEEAKADKPAEKKDRFSDIAPPDGASEATKKGWKALREKANSEVESAESRINAITSELETLKRATPADLAENDRMRAELKAAQDRLAVFDVTAHPDFVRQYTEPKAKALSEAKLLISDNAQSDSSPVSDSALNSILELPRKEFAQKVSEMAGTMQAFDQTSFVSAMREARRVVDSEKGALANASELRNQMQAKAAKNARDAYESAKNNFSSKVPSLEIPPDASEEDRAEIQSYNQARDEAMMEAERNTFGRMTEAQVANLAIEAANMKVVAKHIVPSMQKREKLHLKMIQELTSELTAIKGKKSNGSFSANAEPVQRDPSKPMTTNEIWAEAERRTAAGHRIS